MFTNIPSDLTQKILQVTRSNTMWKNLRFLKRVTKKQLCLKYTSTGSPADFDRHRSYSNQLRSIKHRYELRLSKSGPKTVYKSVRSKILAKVSAPIICDTSNVFARSEEESANILAHFFGNVFTGEPSGNLPYTTPRIKPSLSEKSSPGLDVLRPLRY